jgi:hypothetical protein
MVTFNTLLTQLQAATGFFRLGSDSPRYPSDTVQEHSYQLFYRNSNGYLASEQITIIVSNPGQVSESAEYLNQLPVILQPTPTPPTPSAWETALTTKIAAIKSANAKVKRIIVTELDVTNTFALIVAYIADNATTPTTITKTQYFAYDNGSGTVLYYPYTGALG